MKFKGIFISFFLLIFYSRIYSQQKDFCTWNYINIQYKLNENWSIGLAEHALRYENATEWWMFIHDIFVKQNFHRNVSHELHVRLNNQKLRTNNFDERGIFYYALNINLNTNGWSTSLRTRWQGMAYGMHWNDGFKGPWFYHRFRFGISKSINYHWKLGADVELFQPLNRPQRRFVDQIRVGPSIQNRYNQNLSLDYFFQIQKQLYRVNPYTFFILGIGCNFKL